MTPMHTRRYSAFISYRHADNTQEGRRWAEWLHRALERYVVPPDLIGTPNLLGVPIRDSLYPIFRDEDELPANADLATGIRAALEVSDHLVVLCSPRSAVSPWVRKEVREFKELGRSDRILAIIIAGEPNADDPAKARDGIMRDEECFCEELRFGAVRDDATFDWTIRTEPLAADLRPGGMRAEGFVTAEAFREHLTLNSSHAPEKIAALTETYRQRLDQALLKVIAGLLGVPLGQLVDRDAAHRAELAKRELARAEAEAVRLRSFNRRLAIAGATAMTLALFAGWFWRQTQKERSVAEKAKISAESARAEETKQRKLAEKRGLDLEDAAKKQEQLLHEASMADYAVAVQRIEKDGKWNQGVAHLARALKWEPYNAMAAARLYSTIAFHAPAQQTWPRVVLRGEAPIKALKFNPNGTRIVTVSSDNSARIWNPTTGKTVGDALRHDAEVITAQFSPDGTRIVTLSKDDTVRVWQAETGKAIGEPLRDLRGLNGAVFSPDGTLIVTTTWHGTVEFWDAATRQPVGEPLRIKSGVTYAEFSPDASRILTVKLGVGEREQGEAYVWDARTRRSLSGPTKTSGTLKSAEFSPDGDRIITASSDDSSKKGETQVWDATNGTPIGTPTHHEGELRHARFSPDGLQILTVTSPTDATSGEARLWDAITGKALGSPMRHNRVVWNAYFSTDGSRILTDSMDGTAQVWESTSGKPLGGPLHGEDALFSPDCSIVANLKDGVALIWDCTTMPILGVPLRHSGYVAGAQFSSDSSLVLTKGWDGTARVWSTATGQAVTEPLRHKDRVLSAQFSRDGTRVVTASDDETAQVWDAVTGERIGEPMCHEGSVSNARFSVDGTRILTTSQDQTARVWDAITGKAQGEPMYHEGGVWTAQFSFDGSRVVTCSMGLHYRKPTARLWDAASGKAIGGPFPHEKDVTSARFSPDGTYVVTTSLDKTARAWDAATGKPLGEPMRHTGGVSSMEFNRDGSRILTASDDDITWVWDVMSGKAVGKPVLNTKSLWSGEFSPDGSRIVVMDSGNSARIWDTATGRSMSEPMYHEKYISSAHFSPDGSHVLTAGEEGPDGIARVWETAKGQPLGEPLHHDTPVRGAAFSPDGSHIVITGYGKTARLWNTPRYPKPLVPIPDWVLVRAHAIAALEFDLNGELRDIPPETRRDVILKPPPGDDAWSQLVRWLALPNNQRTLTPDSKFTFRQIAEHERDSGMKEGLESALRYDPTVPLAHVLLAEFEDDPQRATFLRDYGLKRLPEDAILWSRASESFLKQEEADTALEAARKAIVLDDSLIAAQRALAYALEATEQQTEALNAWDKVLADKEATFDDFCVAGYLAAELNLGDKTHAIFHEGEKRYPSSLRILWFKGIALLLIQAPAEALATLQAYEVKLADNDGKPVHDAIVALAVCRWLTGDKDGAVADYQRLIGLVSGYADVDAVTKSDWPDAINQPMLELLTETLKRHPELVPKKEGK